MKRVVRSVIRWIAAGLVLVGGLELGLEFMRYKIRGEWPGWGRCLLGTILAMAGGVLFWASGRLAGKLTEDFDE